VDPALDSAIRTALVAPTGDILPAQLATLTELDASEKGVASLSGIECLTALTSLDISYNPIKDLSPLASLTQLRGLDLIGLATVDLSPLAPLTNLTSLSMGYNTTHIAGFDVVAGMTKLSHLEVYSADLSDISALANCTQLYHVMIDNNNVSVIPPVAGWKKLDFLELFSNRISDISPRHESDLRSLALGAMGGKLRDRRG
jgi:internalin B